MLKLTQCLIVKNEEENLPRALKWGNGLVDEQIVVDTGSSDHTVSLAEKLGAKVVHFQWNQDFSAARNFAITQCAGDWILFLDADEYFQDQDLPLLRPLLEKVHKRTIKRKDGIYCYNAVEMPWVNVASGTVARQTRIFRNVPDLHYEGAIHEQLHASPGSHLTAYSVEKAPAIYHTGYVWTENHSKEAKNARNLDVIQDALKKSPGCAILQLYAAETLLSEGEISKAETYFTKSMMNQDGSISQERLRTGFSQWLSLYLRKTDTAENLVHSAERVYAEAAARFPQEPDYDFLICQVYLKTGNIVKGIRIFTSAMSKNQGGKVTELFKACDPDVLKKMYEACEKLK